LDQNTNGLYFLYVTFFNSLLNFRTSLYLKSLNVPLNLDIFFCYLTSPHSSISDTLLNLHISFYFLFTNIFLIFDKLFCLTFTNTLHKPSTRTILLNKIISHIKYKLLININICIKINKNNKYTLYYCLIKNYTYIYQNTNISCNKNNKK